MDTTSLPLPAVGSFNPLANVSSPYGAPMGRAGYGYAEPGCRIIRLFRVRLSAGGYDTGGAYWGLGQPLFCATDGVYLAFTRAKNRGEAAQRLKLTSQQLLRPV